jgi:hypothetical protein
MGVEASFVLIDEWLVGRPANDAEESANGPPEDDEGRLEAGDLCCSTDELEDLFDEF